jgi:hypothetical protein
MRAHDQLSVLLALSFAHTSAAAPAGVGGMVTGLRSVASVLSINANVQRGQGFPKDAEVRRPDQSMNDRPLTKAEIDKVLYPNRPVRYLYDGPRPKYLEEPRRSH